MIKVLALLLSLSILVITHELGHLGFAKLFGTRVHRFYMFFNYKFSIFKAKKFDGKWHFLFFNATTPKEWEEKEPDNTLWGIGWIPLGGYCDIAGMIDETKSADNLESEPQPWEYRSKPGWQRLCIISGGVLVNFISALLIYACIFAHWGKDELPMRNATLGYEYHQTLLDEGFQNGDIIWSIDGQEAPNFVAAQQSILMDKPSIVTVNRNGELIDIPISEDLITRVLDNNPSSLIDIRLPFVVSDFVAGSTAKQAGIQIGDSLVSINGAATPTFTDITTTLAEHKNETIQMGLWRNGSYMEIPVEVNNAGKLGIFNKKPTEIFDVVHTQYNFFQAIPAGISHGCETLGNYVKSFKFLFVKGGVKNLGGFGTLGSLFPSTWNWYRFWDITALLAIVLAFMNIIPIPGLDGGHILFTLWEIITRRKPSDKFLEIAQTIGMALLLALLVLANGNDIWRWLSKFF